MELEDIVARRNYKFIIDWSCDDCGKPTQIHGVSLEGEPSFGKVSITWNEIIHKKCIEGHLNVPVRTCTGCSESMNRATGSIPARRCCSLDGQSR